MTEIREASADQTERLESGAASEVDALAVLRLRYWQHLLNEMLKRKEFKIPIHMGFGHEAAAVAMNCSMAPDDVLCLSHRNAAYNLARAESLEAILAHYRLTQRSAGGGLMGSMNLAVDGTSIAYSSSILGNNLPVAAGMAMHRTFVKRPGVVFVLVGDGGMEEGTFWETLIFSSSHRLPLVVVVENNDYSMSSTIAQRRSPIDISQICAGLGFGYARSSGAVLEDTKAALSAARVSAAAGSPACVELDLTTFCQHAGPTPGWPDDPKRISIDDGLLVEDSPTDPVFHVRNMLGAAEFQRLSDQVMEGGPR